VKYFRRQVTRGNTAATPTTDAVAATANEMMRAIMLGVYDVVAVPLTIYFYF
jgi:hypothetical protein